MPLKFHALMVHCLHPTLSFGGTANTTGQAFPAYDKHVTTATVKLPVCVERLIKIYNYK
jgi:hypothetical protein